MTARLTRLDWLNHGLRVLAKSGPGALKAEPLAKALKVSRGSFYWHFEDIGQFHVALLTRWRERATDDIILAVERESNDSARLRLLMRIAMTGNNELERSVRSWATHSVAASTAVASVDAARVEYLSRLLKLAGVSETQLHARANFIYWAYIGRVMASEGQGGLSAKDLDSIARLLQS